MKRFISLLLTILLVLISFSSCAIINGKKSYGIYIESDLTSLDPALCNSTNDAIIISQAFRGLYKIDSNNSLQSDLATKYTLSEDGLTYIFDLATGIPWSGSKEYVTAEDVVFSWKRAAAIAAKSNSNYAYLFSNILGYDEALDEYNKTGEFDADKLQISIFPVDNNKDKSEEKSYSLSVTLKEQDSRFLEKLTFPVFYPVNKTTVEVNGDNWAKDPKTCHSNSIYKLSEIKSNGNISFLDIESSYISLVINNKYENYNVDSAVITLYFLTDADKTAVINRFKEDTASDKSKNTLIYVGNLSKDDVTDWNAFIQEKSNMISTMEEKKAKNLEKDIEKYTNDLKSSYSTYEYYLSFNTKVEPFNKPIVRKALTLAIDRKYISEIVCNANDAKPAEAIISNGFMDSSSNKTIRDISGNYFNSERYETYLAKAKAYLKDAGYPNGEGFPNIRYLYDGNDKLAAAIAEAVCKAWANLGITSVSVEAATGSNYTNALKSNLYGVMGSYYNYLSAIDVLNMFTTNSTLNYSKWSNAEYDQIMKDINENSDKILSGYSGHSYSEFNDDAASERLKDLLNEINGSKAAISPMIRDAEDILFGNNGWIVAPVYMNVRSFLCEESLKNTYTSNYGITYFNNIEFNNN